MSTPQVTLDLARRLKDAERPFQMRLIHPGHYWWSLHWWPDTPRDAFTQAGTSHLTMHVVKCLNRAQDKLDKGWTYAPWTLSDPKGLLPGIKDDDLVLYPLTSHDTPYTLVRRLIWTDLDVVDARDESDNLICTLSELGARVLAGRLSITSGLKSPKIEPEVQPRSHRA